MKLRATSLLVVGLVVVCTHTCKRQEPKLLETRVTSFEFRGTDFNRGGAPNRFPGGIGEAAVKLARASRVPICFESISEGTDGTPYPVDIVNKDSTVAIILNQMIRKDPRYEFRERLGVVELRPVGGAEDTQSCLNMTIPIFRISYPWTIAFASLRCQIKNVAESKFSLVVDPMREGCSGRFTAYRPTSEKAIHATFVVEPVRDILDRIVAEAGDAAWTAHYSKPTRTCDSLIISAYQVEE